MNRRRAILLAAAAVIVAIGGVAAYTFWPRGTDEVSEADALEDFRDRNTTTTSTGDGATPTGPRVPAPGVYTYRAEGRQEVTLGPLPTETRPLPETITAVVVDPGDGCFDLTVNFFAQHTEDTRFCVTDGGGSRLDGHTKHQTIGSLTPDAELTCEDDVLIDPDETERPLTCRLEMTGGPAAVKSTFTGTAERGPVEALTVDGQEVPTTPVTIRATLTGDLSGSWVETYWFDDDHLPIRIERDLDLSGPATFRDTSTLDLVSLTPTT